jgi:hypothetical protein
MMSLRIYWRNQARRCAVELVIAASLVAPVLALAKEPAKPVERVTAREAIERQFAAAPAERPEATSAIEAAAILKKYHARIGQMLEPKREIGGGNAGR